MKLITKTYKSILFISILSLFGIATMMTNSYKDIETNTYSSKPMHEIILGGQHSSSIDSNGNLWMWGTNSHGQLGNGEEGTHSSIPINITDQFELDAGETIKQVALGQQHSAAIDSTGDLWMWGDNKFVQLGIPSGIFTVDSPLNLTQYSGNNLEGIKFEQVALGTSHSGAIDSSGDLWMWGDNDNGQVGNAHAGGVRSVSPTNITEKFKLGKDEKIVQVALGTSHSAAIDSTGDLWMWGDNTYGQVGNGNGGINKKVSSPVNISEMYDDFEKIVQVSLGRNHSAAIEEDGDLWVWGDNQYGQLGDGEGGSEGFSSTPIKISNQFDNGNVGIKQIEVGDVHSGAIDSDGNLWMWGYVGNCRVGDNGIDNRLEPINLTQHAGNNLKGKTIKQVSLGYSHSGATDTDGNLWMWGDNSKGKAGTGGEVESICNPKNITDQFFIIYDTYVSDVGSSSATLNYSLIFRDESKRNVDVQYSSDGESWQSGPEPTSGFNTIELTQLQLGQKYTYQVQFVENGTVIYGPTSFPEFTTQKTEPTITTLSAVSTSDTEATLTYSLELGDYCLDEIIVQVSADGFETIVKDTIVTPSETYEIDLTNLIPVTDYTYEIRVIEKNADPTDPINTLAEGTFNEFTTQKTEPTITDLSAVSTSSSEATLNYTLNIGNYEIDDITVEYRNTEETEWSEDYPSVKGPNTIYLSGLTSGITYIYEIRIIVEIDGADNITIAPKEFDEIILENSSLGVWKVTGVVVISFVGFALISLIGGGLGFYLFKKNMNKKS